MSRYAAMFGRLEERGEGAFVPFTVLGDPDPATTPVVLDALVAGGADALELGLPFSDPIADGPVLQAAAGRALSAGTRPDDWWRCVAGVRAAHPALPIGLLCYANPVLRRGIDRFYGEAAAAGADSVLVADLPLDEAAPFTAEAGRHGLAQVFIAPPNAEPARLARVASASRGYVYVTTRAGVTGVDELQHDGVARRLADLWSLGAAPALLGFGIAEPAQVRSALAAGAAGAISGSAVARLIAGAAGDADRLAADLARFVRRMKEATRR